MLSLLLKPYIIMPLVMIFVGMAIKEKRLALYLFCFAVLMGYIAFHYEIPGAESDLYWHTITLNNFKSMGFAYFAVFDKSASLPVFSLYFYLISLLPSERYLPAITAFLVYGINYWLVFKLKEKYELKKRTTLLLVVFILCNLNYLGVISGIRFNLAVSIMLFGLYLDLAESKYMRAIGLYIIAMLLHSSIYIMIIVRLLVIPFTGKLKKIYIVVVAALTVAGIQSLGYLSNSLSNKALNDSLSELLSKTELYMANKEQGAFWTTPYYAVLIVFFAYLWARFYIRYRWGEQENQRFMLYEMLLLLLSVMFFNNYVVVGRLVIMANLVIVPCLGIMLSETEIDGISLSKISKLEAIILIECILRLLYYVYLGGYGGMNFGW